MTKKQHFQSMEELLSGLPDTGFTKGTVSNEAAEQVAAQPETWTPLIKLSRGRPIRGQETGSITKSIRFPEDAWARIKEKAARLNLTPHAAIRKAILDWAQAPDQALPPQAPSLALTSAPALVPVLAPAPGPAPVYGMVAAPIETILSATTDFMVGSGTPSYVGFLGRNPLALPH